MMTTDIPTDPGAAQMDAPGASEAAPAGPAPTQMPPPPLRTLNLRPDAPDLRDRLYAPILRGLPSALNSGCADAPEWQGIVQDQRDSVLCAGYALAGLIEVLKRQAWQAAGENGPAPSRFSPFMLYYMACCYNEIPGLNFDAGTTARSAMKGWHNNGACRLAAWDHWEDDSARLGTAWAADAFQTPLGAYFRIDHCEITDLHAALNEVGVIFCTAQVHGGWQTPNDDGDIPYNFGDPITGGHAFLLVGYDDQGFWVLNSWGTEWGKNGFARLSYADWQANAMDAWIAQIGVHISRQAPRLAHGLSDGAAGRALLASDPKLSAQQVNAYVIDLENNGVLSSGGQFHTTPGDLDLLLTTYLNNALNDWGLANGNAPIPVAIYAHGGLDDEDAAEDIAKLWIPDLLAARIFPIFIMWETGILETLQDKLADQIHGLPPLAGASFWESARQRAEDWYDDRFETLVSGLGTPFWEEIKKNAADDPVNPAGGLPLLLQKWVQQVPDPIRSRMRLHLIGHSAGSVLQGALLPPLRAAGLTVEGVHLMAAACRVEFFEDTIRNYLDSGEVPHYTQLQLTDAAEYKDTCAPLPYYRSLLYLLSNACERQRGRPLLGMQKFFNAANLRVGLPAALDWQVYDAPGPQSGAMHHGDFSHDEQTRKTVIQRILGQPVP